MQGTEKRIARSIRIEPNKEEYLKGTYGSIQKFFDQCVETEFSKGVTAIVKKAQKRKEEINVEDF